MAERGFELTRTRALIGGAALIALVVLILFLTGIIGGSDYWDGGSRSGEPVINLAGDLTEEAHEELEECGHSDDDAQALAEGGGVTETFTVEGGEVESTGTISTSQVAPGVVEVSCEP